MNWNCLFVTPGWLQCVLTHLGARGEPLILAVRNLDQLIGIAPLAVSGKQAYFLGNPDVCDYQDIVSVPGQEANLLHGLIEYLENNGICTLDLETLRSDAAVWKGLKPLAETGSVSTSRSCCDVTYETRLPDSWENYLKQLNGKQRHEVRRKIRRLDAAGPFTYRLVQTGPTLAPDIALFLALFQMNRRDKAEFMDDAMSAYFDALMNTMARYDLLRLNILELAGDPVAAVLCFDFKGTRYLYNSAYDARRNDLSVGILSKVFSIRSAIEAGLEQYDFLKGDESYKKRIGGRLAQLYRCKIQW